jgi:fumarate hydratase, class I
MTQRYGEKKSAIVDGRRMVAFADLGMEAIYEFEVKDMPVTVAVDSTGRSIHQEGPVRWARQPAAVPPAAI